MVEPQTSPKLIAGWIPSLVGGKHCAAESLTMNTFSKGFTFLPCAAGARL